MKRWIIGLASLGLLLGLAAQARSGQIMFTDRTAFLAAAGGTTTVSFAALSGQSFQTLDSTVSSAIPKGVSFSSTGGTSMDLFVAPAGFNGNPAITKDSLFANFLGTPLIATFSPTVTAIGAEVIPFNFGGETATITITTHDASGLTSTMYTVTPPEGSAAFFGVVTTDGTVFDQISFLPPPGFTAGVNDFTLSVPEPASITLLGIGIASMAAYGWRRRAKGVSNKRS
jgi:hypothetical protein